MLVFNCTTTVSDTHETIGTTLSSSRSAVWTVAQELFELFFVEIYSLFTTSTTDIAVAFAQIDDRRAIHRFVCDKHQPSESSVVVYDSHRWRGSRKNGLEKEKNVKNTIHTVTKRRENSKTERRTAAVGRYNDI